MGKIVAIGGGEIGRPGYPVETTGIDREIIKLSGKRRPRLLFISTASSDAVVYVKAVEKHFGQRLGCQVDFLLLARESLAQKTVQKKILESDIVYVGGGNTLKMMKIWRRAGVDKVLSQAFQKGIILAGLSAGAICWFRYGLSDSGNLKKGRKKSLYTRVKGLNLINLTVSPHHIREKSRRRGLISIMKKTPGVGIALDDYAALEIVDDQYRVIRSKTKARAHKVYFDKNKLYYKPLKSGSTFLPLISLRQRS